MMMMMKCWTDLFLSSSQIIWLGDKDMYDDDDD